MSTHQDPEREALAKEIGGAVLLHHSFRISPECARAIADIALHRRPAQAGAEGALRDRTPEQWDAAGTAGLRELEKCGSHPSARYVRMAIDAGVRAAQALAAPAPAPAEVTPIERAALSAFHSLRGTDCDDVALVRGILVAAGVTLANAAADALRASTTPAANAPDQPSGWTALRAAARRVVEGAKLTDAGWLLDTGDVQALDEASVKENP